MQKIASPQDLQTELRWLLNYAQSPHPSRTQIASTLNELANRVGDTEPDFMNMAHYVSQQLDVALAMRDAGPFGPERRDLKNAWNNVATLLGKTIHAIRVAVLHEKKYRGDR